MKHDVVIIGGGAAGLGAALYAARFKLNTLVLAGQLGGTGNIAHLVDNWIGDPGVKGFDLMQKFIKHVKEYDVELKEERVVKVKKIRNGFSVETGKKKYDCKTILFCMGMKHRELGLSNEKEFLGRGLSYCYTCDGMFFKNKIVGVVGGSDSAAMGALYLADVAKKVYVFYRKSKLRAEPVSSEQVYKNKKISVVHGVNVKKLEGGKFLEAVKLDNGDSFKLNGLFIEIGRIPNISLVEDLVQLDKHGHIQTDENMKTSVPGLFAVGDVSSVHEYQYVISAGQGCIALIKAAKYLVESDK